MAAVQVSSAEREFHHVSDGRNNYFTSMGHGDFDVITGQKNEFHQVSDG